jgi:hypothetical protein
MLKSKNSQKMHKTQPLQLQLNRTESRQGNLRLLGT